MEYNNVPYTQDELFRLLEDNIAQAVSVEDFMQTHKVDHFYCRVFIDGKACEAYPQTSQAFSDWLGKIREARKKGRIISPMHCCSVLKDSNAELRSFIHGDVRDTGRYVIRQQNHFNNLRQTALPGAFDVEDTISVLSWNDAISRIVECHYDKAVVVRIEEAKFSLVREAGSQGKSVDGRAYATLGAARDAMEQIQKMYRRKRQISQYTQDAMGQQTGARPLQIDRYSYINGWVPEEENCYTGPVKYAIQYHAGPYLGSYFAQNSTGAEYSGNPHSFSPQTVTFDTLSAAAKKVRKLPKGYAPKIAEFIVRDGEWVRKR